MSYLELDGLAKSFGDKTVLTDFSLAVERGEILALLGPSGSGKTTALRILAGFETPDQGRIRVDGQDVTELPPARRHFGMVFQHYALFPHLTAAENVAFGLEAQKPKRTRDQVAARVQAALELVELPHLAARKPGELSGGQQQRVALARALAPEPRVLLLDEPLSNLDPSLRERTRRELRRAIHKVGITTVLVTHEQEEAFDLGDRVALLSGGTLEQVGTAEELYERPATRFAATFIGRASSLSGVLEEVLASGVRVRLGGGVFWVGVKGDSSQFAAGLPVEVILRPENLALAEVDAEGALVGTIEARRYAGATSFFSVALGEGVEVEVLAASSAARVGDRVGVVPAAGRPGPRVFGKVASA